MKITNEQLLNLFAFNIGDKVKFKSDKNIFEVKEDNYGAIILQTKKSPPYPLSSFINIEYKIIKPKKTYGETCCNDYLYCKKCPLGILKCNSSRTNSKSSLYETLNDICSNYSIKSNNPIYLAFKAELDKEVE